MLRPILYGLLLATLACEMNKPPVDHSVRAPGESGGKAADAQAVSESQSSLVSMDEAIAMNKATDDKLHLVVRVMFPKSAFEFYEPAPGRIVYSEVLQGGAHSHQDISAGTQKAADVWTKLMPGMPVPQVLLDVDVRAEMNAKAEALPGQTERSPSVHRSALTMKAPDDVTTVSSALSITCGTPPANIGSCDHTWFRYNECQNMVVNGASHYNWCLYNWSGGRTSWDGSDEDVAYAAAYACTGNIALNMTADYGGGAWTISKGYARWARPGYNCDRWCYPICDWCADQHIQYDVTATNVVFDHCGTFNDYDNQ